MSDGLGGHLERDDRPIGTFDSGVGGLTVVRAMIDLLPHESVLYFGDTARFPYGQRSLEEIAGFAREIAAYLLSRDVKMLVVACNSIEVAAIEALTEASGVPVAGVVDPGARAAVAATRNGRIGVIGTEATIASGAYERAIARTGADVELLTAACPAFVRFVERGDTTSPALRAHAEQYLAPLAAAGVDTLVLGCTHYPLLAGLLRLVMGPEVTLVSSAEETAKDVYATLVGSGSLAAGPPRHEFVSSGDPELFRALGGMFLGPEVSEVRGATVAGVGSGPWT
ncbi:MAG TPA: glutamate racemase [Actinomycetota bacterium]|nr:glutamate racemase [Actinomycetota bacterium]